MDAYLARLDVWQLSLALAAIVIGVGCSAIAYRWPRLIGRAMIAFTVLSVGVGTAPWWLRAMGTGPHPELPIHPVILEIKVIFIVGALAVLGFGGRGVLREQAKQ